MATGEDAIALGILYLSGEHVRLGERVKAVVAYVEDAQVAIVDFQDLRAPTGTIEQEDGMIDLHAKFINSLFEGSSTSIDFVKDEVAKLSGHVSTLKKEHEDMVSANAEHLKDIDALSDANSKLEAKINDLEDKATRQETALSTANANLKTFKEKVGHLKEAKEKATDALKRSRSAHTTTRQQKAAIKEELNKAEATVEEHRARIIELEAEPDESDSSDSDGDDIDGGASKRRRIDPVHLLTATVAARDERIKELEKQLTEATKGPWNASVSWRSSWATPIRPTQTSSNSNLRRSSSTATRKRPAGFTAEQRSFSDTHSIVQRYKAEPDCRIMLSSSCAHRTLHMHARSQI